MIPSELSLGEVYLPPTLVVGALAVVLAWLTILVLNRYRLSRYFVALPLVFLSIAVIYAVIIGSTVIRI